MIEVEFLRPTKDHSEHVAEAWLIVNDDGSHSMRGNVDLILTDVPFPLVDPDTGNVRRITFEDEPEVWARHCELAFRTPYLVPRIVQDIPSAGVDGR